MPPTIGSRLGSHEIVGRLGAGGMGEVFLAHDTKLKRRVAIKVLPAASAHDADRLARFHREAQAVAALNHPNIATIYDLEEAGGTTYLVLELVEGDTLAERLRRGPLSIAESVTIMRQILEALEAAHEKAICHRDLKPANVKLTSEGVVKVLDFGIAKFLDRSSERHEDTTVEQTSPGVVIGTPGYMSPEQAKGGDADERSDIFSCGCIFYELLTGCRAFDGDTTSEAMASVLKSDVDFSKLPPALHPWLREILARCLEKNPRQRWHAAADVRLQLESAAAGARTDEPSPRPKPWVRPAAVAAATAIALVTGGYAAWLLKPEAPRALTRFMLPLPAGQQFSHVGRAVLALSPDGSHLVYVANRRLYLRPMAGIESTVIAGSEEADGVQHPVFSPDGQWIVFRSVGDAALKRLPVTGGTAVTICKSDALYGMEWNDAGVLFGQLGKGIMRVSPDGGEPEVLVAVADGDTADGPQLLPGGKTVLYSLRKATEEWDQARIMVRALDGGEPREVMAGGSAARLLPTGHLVYAVASTLFARPFDLASHTLTGRAVPVIEGIDRGSLQGGQGPVRSATAHYVAASNGTLVFVPGTRASTAGQDLAWFDPKAPPAPLGLPPDSYVSPRTSPDGRWVAVERGQRDSADIWIVDLSGSAAIRRLTFGGRSSDPVWGHDSTSVVFRSDRDGDGAIYRQRADGSGTAERLTTPDAGAAHVPQSMSPDGAHLLFTEMKGNRQSLWVLSTNNRRVSPIAGIESADLIEAAFSPDGRWVVYQLVGQARRGLRAPVPESFVMPFPVTGTRYQVPVTTNTVGNPVWSARGDAILASVAINRDMTIPVTTTPAFTFGTPEFFPQGARLTGLPVRTRRNWDPHRDGRIIGAMIAPGQAAAASDVPGMHVVLNWFDELRQRVR